jgi:hypothetical protein
MPSRVIRGEILTSDSLSRVSRDAESLFWRLIIAADDFGRLDGRLGVLRAAAWPARDDVTAEQIGRWLDELAGCDPDGGGPVIRYAVQGRPYLQLRNWEQHRAASKRAAKSRFPAQDSPGAQVIPADPRGSPGAPEDPHPSDDWRLTSDVCRLAIGVSIPPEPPPDGGASIDGQDQAVDLVEADAVEPAPEPEKAPAPKRAPSPEAVQLCERFVAYMGECHPAARVPATGPQRSKWEADLDRMLRGKRARRPQDISDAIDWLQQDNPRRGEFAFVVQSPRALDEKLDRIRVEMSRPRIAPARAAARGRPTVGSRDDFADWQRMQQQRKEAAR